MKPITIDALLLDALSRGASDLHLSAGAPPMMRLGDALQPLPGEELTPQATEGILAQVCGEELRRRVAAQGSADFSYAIAGRGRFRVNAYRQRGALSLSFRLCMPSAPDADQLGLPEAVRGLAERRSGLVLLSGVARSGKSTTAAWLVDRIAETRPAHIITVEEPIEVLFRHRLGLVDQKEVGVDAPDRLSALRASLNEDPDVLYVSSANDGDTLTLALEAALGGKLVLCVLDSPGVPSTVQYVLDVASGGNAVRVRAQLAEALAAVVAHRAVPSAGRPIVLHEILLATDAVKNLFRQDKLHQLPAVMENSAALGMQTFDRALALRVAEGRLTSDQAEGWAGDRQAFRRYVMEHAYDRP